jgi:hypothetical protein
MINLWTYLIQPSFSFRWCWAPGPLQKAKICEYLTARSPPKKVSVFFIFFFSGQKRCDELLRCFLQLLEHPAVWLEAFFELSNNFDIPIH